MAKLKTNLLKFKELEKCINYYEMMNYFSIIERGKITPLDYEKLEADGHDVEDEYPFSILEVEKLGYTVDEELIECQENDEVVKYYFNLSHNCIEIETDKFTLKEGIIVLDLVKKQLRADYGRCYEVIFGHTSDNEHFTHYHQEATDYGLWWSDFLRLYQEKIENIGSIGLYLEDGNKIHIVMYSKEDVV